MAVASTSRKQGIKWCLWSEHSVPPLAFYAHSYGVYVAFLNAFAQAQQLLLELRCEYQFCVGPIKNHLAASITAHSELAVKELVEGQAVEQFRLVVARLEPVVVPSPSLGTALGAS